MHVHPPTGAGHAAAASVACAAAPRMATIGAEKAARTARGWGSASAVLVALTVSVLVAPSPVSAQDASVEGTLEARIWLDRGSEPTLHRGERVRVYYRTSADAYVAIFHIDTDGAVRLLHPRAPDEDDYVRGGRDYRLLFPRSPYWYVDEYDGKGYFFIVASPRPLDFSEFAYSYYGAGWDLSQVGRQIYRDPYVAMDDYVAALIPDWEQVGYGLDFLSYNVGQVYEYPRFLCYECHGFRTFATWNPYRYACTNFRVVVYDDPYFYPAFRYRGDRVVFVSPLRARPRFAFKERAAGEASRPLVVRRPAPRTSGDGAVSGRPARVPSPGVTRARPSGGVRSRSSAQPPARRQPSSSRTGFRAPPRRRAPEAGGAASEGRAGRTPGEGTSLSSRPTLERRPEARAPTSRDRGRVARPRTARRAPARPSSRVRPEASGGVRAVPPARRVPTSSVRPSRPRSVRPVPKRTAPSSRRPTARARPVPSRKPSARPPTARRPVVKPRGGSKPQPRTPRRKPGGGGGA